MPPWIRWNFFINPASYAFEALMVNEWNGLELTCQPPQYIPFGDGYANDKYRACTVLGSNGNSILGGAYVKAQYNHSASHTWRNFGILVAFWIFFAVVTAIGFERADQSGGSSRLLFERRESVPGSSKAKTLDEEEGHESKTESAERATG